MWYLRSTLLALLFSGCAARLYAADQPTLSIKRATIGFGGKYKAGFWQPIQLTVVAAAGGATGRLSVVGSDGDQTPVEYRDDERGQINLASGQEQTLLLYGKCGPSGTRFRLKLADSGISWQGEIPANAPALSSTSELIVGLGGDLGLSEAVALRRRFYDNVAAAIVEQPASLPDRWWAYSGVDALIITTREPWIGAISDEQRQAIIDWVLLGGRLIFACGANAHELLGAGSPWAKLMPGELDEVEPLRDRTGLENYTKAELPFNDPGFQRNRPLVARLKNVLGEVLLDEQGTSSNRPLIVRAPAGLGQITFVAFDLEHPALKDWKGRPRLIAGLLGQGDAQHDRSEQEARVSVTHLGYDDLIGQLNSALDRFPNVSIVNFTTVALLIIGYLAIAAPGDYFFLSRLKLPRHWTWITFPLCVAVTVAAATAVGRQNHGLRQRLNQVEVIDIDLRHQIVRGTSWLHLFSAATSRQVAALSVNPPNSLHAAKAEGWLAWQGLPGDSLGGLESHQPPLVEREAYGVNLPDDQPLMERFVVPVASAKSLSGVWWARTQLAYQAKLTLDRYGLLSGEFLQPLDVPLEECLLAHGEKLYRIGALAPGQRVSLADFPPLDLEARLTQRRIEQSKDVATPWDKASVDVPRIMQMILFHESARGRSYTGLTHRYQPELDLSEHIRLGQAVLVGRAKQPVSTLTDASSARLVDESHLTSHTWYRLIFPVTPRSTDN